MSGITPRVGPRPRLRIVTLDRARSPNPSTSAGSESETGRPGGDYTSLPILIFRRGGWRTPRRYQCGRPVAASRFTVGVELGRGRSRCLQHEDRGKTVGF